MIEPSLIDHLVFFLGGIVLPLLTALRSGSDWNGLVFTSKMKRAIYINNGLLLWLGAGIILTVWLINGRSLAAMGFAFPNPEHVWTWTAMILLFCLLYGVDTIYQVISAEQRAATRQKWDALTPFMPTRYSEMLSFTFLAMSAAVCEEIIFRGFFIQYITYWTGISGIGLTVAIFIPGVIFAISHLYQGWHNVFKIVIMAMLFGYIYFYSNSLWIVILLHFIVDMIGGLIGVHIISRTKPQAGPGNEE